jgi:hypothetical protein
MIEVLVSKMTKYGKAMAKQEAKQEAKQKTEQRISEACN